MYLGAGGGCSVSCFELLNLLCSLVLGGNCSSLYSVGMFVSICFHVFVASLCRYMFIGSNRVWWCSVSDGILSTKRVSAMNLIALVLYFL